MIVQFEPTFHPAVTVLFEADGGLWERAAGAACAQTGAVVFFHSEDEVADVDFVGVFDDVGSGDFAPVDVGAVEVLTHVVAPWVAEVQRYLYEC